MKQVKLQGRKSDVIQKLFAIHNREIDEVRNGIKEFGVALEETTEVIREVISDLFQILNGGSSKKEWGSNSK
jgi:hypothetical protein